MTPQPSKVIRRFAPILSSNPPVPDSLYPNPGRGEGEPLRRGSGGKCKDSPIPYPSHSLSDSLSMRSSESRGRLPEGLVCLGVSKKIQGLQGRAVLTALGKKGGLSTAPTDEITNPRTLSRPPSFQCPSPSRALPSRELPGPRPPYPSAMENGSHIATSNEVGKLNTAQETQDRRGLQTTSDNGYYVNLLTVDTERVTAAP